MIIKQWTNKLMIPIYQVSLAIKLLFNLAIVIIVVAIVVVKFFHKIVLHFEKKWSISSKLVHLIKIKLEFCHKLKNTCIQKTFKLPSDGRELSLSIVSIKI